MNFHHPLAILKATPEERTGRIKIFLRASSDKEDSVGEVVLKSAFADGAMRNEFIRTGYFDWNHLTDIIDIKCRDAHPSDLTNLQIAKAKAIIGKPEAIGFKDDFPRSMGITEEGLFCSGYLIAENEFSVEIRKGLEAGVPYGASISGYARREDKIGNTIKKIQLRKIAIQPLQESVNQDTAVSLMKSSFPSLTNLINKGFDMTEASNPTEDLSMDSRLQIIEGQLQFLMRHLLNSNPAIIADEIAEIMREDVEIVNPKFKRVDDLLCKLGLDERTRAHLLDGVKSMQGGF